MTSEERARRIGQAIGEILVHVGVLWIPKGLTETVRDVEAEFTERELSSAEEVLTKETGENTEGETRPSGREIDDPTEEEKADDVYMEEAGFGGGAPGVAITPE